MFYCLSSFSVQFFLFSEEEGKSCVKNEKNSLFFLAMNMNKPGEMREKTLCDFLQFSVICISVVRMRVESFVMLRKSSV